MLHSLNTAQTGLSTSKVQVENVMNNIANENTDGYKTRNVSTEEAKQIDNRISGRGSSVIDVNRVTDMYMYENILQEDSKASAYEELDLLLEQVEGVFNETDTSGLSVDLEKYFESLESLRLSPENEIYRNDMINNGNILVDSIKNLYSQLEALELESKAKLEDHVGTVNNILDQIGSINDEIRQKHYATNDMLDKRDSLEQELTKYTDVSIIHSSVEDYNLEIGGESAVRFYNNVHTMDVNEEKVSQKDVYGEFNSTGQYVSSLVESTWGSGTPVSEEQTLTLSTYPTYYIDLTGASTTVSGDKVKFSIGSGEDYIYTADGAQSDTTIAAKILEEGTITIDDVDYTVTAGGSSTELILVSQTTTVPSLPIQVEDESGPVDTSAVDTTSGLTNGSVYFLGTQVTGTAAGDNIEDVVDAIIADETDIINTWNANHPEMEIDSLSKTSADSISIVYKDTEGDLPNLVETTSSGIIFSDATEDTKGVKTDYSVTYNYNNITSFTINYGDTVNGLVVDETNIVQSMVYMINNTDGIKENVTAYNGQYSLDMDGNKVLKQPVNIDHYLVVESNVEGDKGKFISDIIVSDSTAASSDLERIKISKDESRSKIGADEVSVRLFEKDINITSGEFSSILDNLNTTDNDNKIAEYKDLLDTFVDTFVDMQSSYIELGPQEYIFGSEASMLHEDYDEKIDLNLFEGSTVDTLSFNDKMVYSLSQENLDYLTQVRWKEDIEFGDDHTSSFTQFYESIRVTVAQDRELTIQRKENQSAVQESLQATYDKLVKVDKDEEMVNLIKFQAAYEANAKMITVVDEMLQTILGLKR